MSADGKHAIVIILFVGSVFSPYYAWSKWQNPGNHCAINVAVYGPSNRWAMTERNLANTVRAQNAFKAGRSEARVVEDGLVIDIDEYCAPIPRRLRGQICVTLPYLNTRAFSLSADGRHHWTPACAQAELDVAFDQPQFSWRGRGYVDMNFGAEPLEKGFDYWDWSRTPLSDGDTLIRYVTDPKDAPQRKLCLRLSPDGRLTETEGAPSHPLPATRIWRVKRRTGMLDGEKARIDRTLEDTPFYSRTLLQYPNGTSGLTTHETLSCKRLSSPLVKAMLPFRMPRLSL